MAMGLVVTQLVVPTGLNPADGGALNPIRNSAARPQSDAADLSMGPSSQPPKVQVTFGKYSGTGLTEAEALKPIQQASYADIMTHEMAHYSKAGALAQVGPVVETNGQGIAIAGHVTIRLGGLDAANPETSYANAHQAMCAACAPSDMSAQDQSVAASASRLMCEAQALIQQKAGWANLMASAAQSTGAGSAPAFNPAMAGNRLSLSG